MAAGKEGGFGGVLRLPGSLVVASIVVIRIIITRLS